MAVVSIIVQASRVHMVMVLAIGSGVAKTVIEGTPFEEKRIPKPSVVVLVRHGVLRIEQADAILPYTDMAQARIDGRARIGLRATGDFKDKILVGGRVRIARPWPNVVTGDAGATDIDVLVGVLYLLHIGEDATVSSVPR